MLQGIGMSQRGRKRTNDGAVREASSTAGEWLEKPKVPEKKAKKGKQTLQLALAMPGSLGSGLATLRGSGNIGTSSTSSSQLKSGPPQQQKLKMVKDGTIGRFLVDKNANANANAPSNSTSVTKKTTGKSTRQSMMGKENKFASAILAKGEGREKAPAAAEALVPDSETEGDDDDETLESLVSQHELDINLQSDRSDNVNPFLPEAQGLFLPPMPTPAPARKASLEVEDLPLDDCIPPEEAQPSLFGFGGVPLAKPAPAKQGPSSAKRRRVIETSSPVHASSPPARQIILASPSSQLSPVQTDRHLSDLEEDNEVQDPIEPVANHVYRQIGVPASEKRAGSRIPWDSDDDDERSRLNITHSAAEIQRDLVALRDQRVPLQVRSPLSPRKLPTVRGETTNYMDQFRDESYSPVQYTWTESFANNVRGKFGMSPKARVRIVQHKKKRPDQIGRKENSQLETVAEGDKVADAELAASWFDDSATEHSTISQPVPSQPRPQLPVRPTDVSTIDDSGFVPSSSSPLRAVLAPDSRASDESQCQASIPSSQQEQDSINEDGKDSDMLLPETFVQPTAGRSRQDSNILPLTGLLGYPETEPETGNGNESLDSMEDSQDEGAIMDLEYSIEDSQPSAGESQEVEFELLGRRRRILAPDTQEVLNVETQNIEAGETQFPVGKSIPSFCEDDHSGEMSEVVPCSQQGTLAPDSEGMSLDDFEAESMIPESTAPSSKAKRSVEASISSAWFSDVLAEARAASAAAKAIPQQSALTSFFPAKPGGPASKLAREEESQRSALVRAVEGQAEERRLLQQQKRVSFADESSTNMVIPGEEEEVIADSDVEDDEEIEVLAEETQYIPSSQTQCLDGILGREPLESPMVRETQEVADSDVDEGESRDLEEDFDVDQLI